MTYCNVVYCVSAGRNPTPGIIINHKHGKDVYGGVVIDYRGKVSYESPAINAVMNMHLTVVKSLFTSELRIITIS